MTPRDSTVSSVTPRPARALLILNDHWLGALLRAELLEGGQEAECAPSLGAALLGRSEAPSVILVDQADLTAVECTALEVFAIVGDKVRVILLGRGASPPVGPWDSVVRRPVLASELLRVVSRALEGALPSAPRHAPSSTTLRCGPPWPMIGCKACFMARHYERARTPREVESIAVDAARFVLEHARCATPDAAPLGDQVEAGRVEGRPLERRALEDGAFFPGGVSRSAAAWVADAPDSDDANGSVARIGFRRDQPGW